MTLSSSIRNPQSSIRNPDDWLTVDAAAELTGLTVRRWRQLAERAFHRQLAHKAPPPGGKGKAVWWVSRTLDKRLTCYPSKPTREDRARRPLLARYPEPHVHLAYRKARWLREWREHCRHPRPAGVTDAHLAARIVDQAKREIPDEPLRISVRSLQIWHKAYNALGPDGRIVGVSALIPNYRGQRLNPQSAEPTGSCRVNPQSRSPQAIEYFYGLFHAPNRLSAKMCHEATLREARSHGWIWPKAYTATTRWLRENDARDMTCLHRQGAGAYAHKHMPHLQTDWDAINPGEMYVCDHHQVDFWVVYRDKQIRPWLTATQDMRSRMIVGWRLGPAPHSEAIASSFRMAFRDWAIPKHMRIDNGKDFSSKWLAGLTKSEVRQLRREFGSRWKTILREKRDRSIVKDPRWLGLMPELGIKIIYAIPYAAWSKGTIERWFGTFEGQCGTTFVTYCGNRPDRKPECLDQIRRGRSEPRASARANSSGLEVVDTSDIPTLDQARKRVRDYIGLYHRSPHGGDGMRKRTPLQVWATAATLQKAEPEALAFLMNVRGTFRVGGNGVTVNVAGTRIGYGARSPALTRLKGRDVLVAVDIDRPAEAFAFDPASRRLLGRLEANERIHPCATTDDVREAIAETQRDRKVMRQAKGGAANRTRTAAHRINAHYRDRSSELAATGTDDSQPQANITPVRTGFEGAADTVRPGVGASTRPDRKSRDLSFARAALGHGIGLSKTKRKRPRATDDLLRGRPLDEPQAAMAGGQDDNGMDAGQSSTDLLKLIGGGIRHERKPG